MSSRFGVLFDMDGVIVDSNPWHKKALDIFFDKHKIVLAPGDLETKLWGRANKDWIPAIMGKSLTLKQVQKLSEEKEAIYRDIYKDHVASVNGLETFLENLKAAEVLTTVSTSAITSNVRFILEETALERFFDAIIDERGFSTGKPDPEVYLNSAMAIDVIPSRCIVIEDSLAGVTSGQAAGMKVIGITTTHSAEELKSCDLVINDFTGLSVMQLENLFM